MKKIGNICLVISFVGFAAYLFKIDVIGYYSNEEALLNVLGVVLVICVFVSFLLRWQGSRQENASQKENAERALKEKYQNNSK